jgi:hypothetical protein
MDALSHYWSWATAAGAGYLAFLVLVSMFFMATARGRRAWDVWADDQVRALYQGRKEERSDLTAW